MESKKSDQEGAEASARPPQQVAVAGRLDRSLADFERACLVHLADEQGRPSPNNALIAVLCDAVRLAREYPPLTVGEASARPSPPQLSAADFTPDEALQVASGPSSLRGLVASFLDHGLRILELEAALETVSSLKLGLYRCTVCGTRWLLWPDSVHGGGWNLLDHHQRPGACCDNAAMGDQIEHLRDIELGLPLPSPDLLKDEE